MSNVKSEIVLNNLALIVKNFDNILMSYDLDRKIRSLPVSTLSKYNLCFEKDYIYFDNPLLKKDQYQRCRIWYVRQSEMQVRFCNKTCISLTEMLTNKTMSNLVNLESPVLNQRLEELDRINSLDEKISYPDSTLIKFFEGLNFSL